MMLSPDLSCAQAGAISARTALALSGLGFSLMMAAWVVSSVISISRAYDPVVMPQRAGCSCPDPFLLSEIPSPTADKCICCAGHHHSILRQLRHNRTRRQQGRGLEGDPRRRHCWVHCRRPCARGHHRGHRVVLLLPAPAMISFTAADWRRWRVTLVLRGMVLENPVCQLQLPSGSARRSP